MAVSADRPSAGKPEGVPALLKTINLTKSFGAMKAVNKLSMAVAPGEIFGIAGPNGAGKTTLFNLITGYLKGTGQILFAGKDIAGRNPHQICHIGVVRTFQIPSIFETLTVRDNIRFGAHFGNSRRRTSDKRIDSLLEWLDLQSVARQTAGNVGLYYKKLTMIAACLATNPRMLLLDEPIGGLSPAEIGPLTDLILRINEELEVTVIIIEHLMRVLKRVSHRLMIIHYGEQICVGPPAEVMADAKVQEVYLG